MKQHPAADVLVSFASLRSAYESTVEAMSYPQVSFLFAFCSCNVILHMNALLQLQTFAVVLLWHSKNLKNLVELKICTSLLKNVMRRDISGRF